MEGWMCPLDSSGLPDEYSVLKTLDDRFGYAAIRRDPTLTDAVMYSTDYPHSVTLWPHSEVLIKELTEGWDEDARHKVLAGNAVSLYHLA